MSCAFEPAQELAPGSHCRHALVVDRCEDRVLRRLQDGESCSDDVQAVWDALTADYGEL